MFAQCVNNQLKKKISYGFTSKNRYDILFSRRLSCYQQFLV